MSANNNAINSTGIASETVFKIPSMRKLSETIDARKSRNESRERPRKMFTKQEIHDYKRKYNGLRDMLSSERSKSPELKVLISDALIFYKLVTGLSNAFFDKQKYESIQWRWKYIKQVENILIKTIVAGEQYDDVFSQYPLTEDDLI